MKTDASTQTSSTTMNARGYFSALRLLVSILLCFTDVLLSSAIEAPPSPHILFVILDDLGSNDLGLHGTGILTPVCDALVNGEDAIYLSNYYVLPYCSPTRASILSGRYPIHHGLYGVLHDDDTQGLPLEEETLPQVLQKAGYNCRMIGKWHVGHSRWEQTPTFRGFESFFGFYLGGQNYTSHYKWGYPAEKYDLRYDKQERCGEGCSQIVDERGNYSTHVFTREAVRLVDHYYDDRPLFLLLAHQAVHFPDQVPQEYIDLYREKDDWTLQRKTYGGMLTAADESIGLVIDALKRKEMWNNTLLVVTTDNGGPTALCAVQGSSNHPKRGGKCTVYDGGTRGDAFIVFPPAHAEYAKLRNYTHLFHAVDWLPTLADLVGAIPSGKPLDGKSHLDSFRGMDSPPHQELYIGHAQLPDNQTYWYGPALRYQNFKIIRGTSGGPEQSTNFPNGTDPPGAEKKRNDDKYIMYDLQTDPSETTDVYHHYPVLAQILKSKLNDYEAQLQPPIPNDPTCVLPDLDYFNTSEYGIVWRPWCDRSDRVVVYN